MKVSLSNQFKVILQIQHFQGCPNSTEMIRRVKEAIGGIKDEIKYQEVLVETNELVEKIKFRGSPTLLINGKDFEEREEPEAASLNCRYYQNGLPTSDDIKEKIKSLHY
jgi:hypothetical protein